MGKYLLIALGVILGCAIIYVVTVLALTAGSGAAEGAREVKVEEDE
jgi:hypothetical protein